MKIRFFFLLLVFVGFLVSTTNGQHPGQSTNQLTRFKLNGDETHVAALKADPRGYKDRTVVIAGGVRIQNYYNYKYENAAQTHFFLRFDELTADMKEIGELDLYASRSFGQPLIDEVLKQEAKGFGKIVRLKIKITSRSFDPIDPTVSQNGQFNNDAELLDWQFFDSIAGEWASWAIEVKAANLRNAEIELQKQKVAEQKAAKEKADAAKQAAAARALKANQDAAVKGDAYGLLRMGERYRDGDGVEKDLAKAKEYLKRAADAGSPTAADELSKLQQ